MISVTIGPVPTDSARAWLTNAEQILGALDRGAEKLPFKLPIETLNEMRDLIDDWRGACRAPEWCETRMLDITQLRSLVTYWFNITKLDDAQRSRLGITFSPPEARAFADALAGGVGTAMHQAPELKAFATRLADSWADCQPAFASATVSASA